MTNKLSEMEVESDWVESGSDNPDPVSEEVHDNTSESATASVGRTSPIWLAFERPVPARVKCIVSPGHCTFQQGFKAQSGTKNLWRHLESSHSVKFAELRQKQKAQGTLFGLG